MADVGDREQLERRGLRLEYATIAWNVVEMIVSIGLGIAARSIALIAFGLDTMVELFASVVVVWQDHRLSRLVARTTRVTGTSCTVAVMPSIRLSTSRLKVS